MTLRDLRTRMNFWQDRLNLREWKITLKWGTGAEVPEMGQVLGCCNWNAEELSATIHISRRQAGHEETLIHELLHIVFEGHEAEVPTYNVHLERALNRTAHALIKGLAE